MSSYLDLGPIDYFPVADSSALRAIGWLGRERTFATGTVSREFFEKLVELLSAPFQPFVAAGFHPCELCQFSGGPAQLHLGERTVKLGVSNLFVPAERCIYVTPSLVAHYIDAHHYRPPEEFIEATMRCPPTSTMEYKRLLLARGGRGLLPQRQRD